MRDTSIATPPAMATTPTSSPTSADSLSSPGAPTSTTPAMTSRTAYREAGAGAGSGGGGGAAVLVSRMRERSIDDGDDGAVV